MIAVNTIAMNLNQGLLVTEDDCVIGGYNTMEKRVVLVAPYRIENVDIPTIFAAYPVERVYHLELFKFDANYKTLSV